MKNRNIFIPKLTDSEIFNFIEQYDWVMGIKNIAKLPYILAGKNNAYLNRLDNGAIVYKVLVPYNDNLTEATLIFTDFKIFLDSKELPKEFQNDIIDRLILANLYYRKMLLNKFLKFPEYQNKLMEFMKDERMEIIKFLQANSNLNYSEINERIFGNETYLFGAPIELAKNLDNTKINNEKYDTERFFHKKLTEQTYGKYVQLKFKFNNEEDKQPTTE